jgi:hypothetical protein
MAGRLEKTPQKNDRGKVAKNSQKKNEQDLGLFQNIKLLGVWLHFWCFFESSRHPPPFSDILA